MVEKQTGKCIQIIRSDKGGEYSLGAFKTYCKNNGIQQQFKIPHTPQQNGVAERKNITLVEFPRSMLQGKNISNGFWAEAINTTIYLKIISSTKSLDFQTPLEVFHGYKLELSHLRVFGCKSFAHVPKYERRKLDAKLIKCIFVGYCTDKKAYKLFDPKSHKLLVSRDVVFHENVDKGDKMNDIGVWHNSNDNDDHAKIYAVIEQEQEQEQEHVQVQEHDESNMDISSSYGTLKRGDKTSQRRRRGEVMKDQEGHHNKMNHQ